MSSPLFQDIVKLSSGVEKILRIPGGSDKTLYLDGRDTGIRLGDDLNFYRKSSGSKVAGKMKIPDFAELHLWWICWNELIFISIIIEA